MVLATVVRVEIVGLGKYDIGAAFVGIDQGHQWALIKYVKEKVKAKR